MTTMLWQPEAMVITADEGGATYFGGDQEWYAQEWQRMAGCGPTAAATLTLYLATAKPGLRALYTGQGNSQSQFAAHMETLYQYVTPGNMGLNKVEMFVDGMAAYAQSRGVRITPHVFDVHGYMHGARPPVDALAAFVRDGLASDSPIAFLNLTKGRVRNIQGWHWITIVGADIDEGCLMATASDEGKQITFDLRLWYLSTRMRGGLVYYTQDAV